MNFRPDHAVVPEHVGPNQIALRVQENPHLERRPVLVGLPAAPRVPVKRKRTVMACTRTSPSNGKNVASA
jgi:hypothetical protein